MTLVKVSCSTCGAILSSKPTLHGKRVKCPKCNSTFVLGGSPGSQGNTSVEFERATGQASGEESQTRHAMVKAWPGATIAVATTAVTLLSLVCALVARQTDDIANRREASRRDVVDALADTMPMRDVQNAAEFASAESLKASAAATPAQSPRAYVSHPKKISPSNLAELMKSVVLLETDRNTLGSGFVVKDGSFIATNFHVVDRASSVRATFSDGTQVEIDGFMAVSKEHDLAVLHLARSAVSAPLQITLERLDSGEKVYAIGAPKGLKFSVTDGLVSACRRWPEIEEMFQSELGKDVEFPFDKDSLWIQTTTPISPGNSGGPLFSESGDVVAINTLRNPSNSAQNINFSIHASHLASLLESLPQSRIPLAQLPSSPKRAESSDRHAAPAGNVDPSVLAWDVVAEVVGGFVCRAGKIADHGKYTNDTLTGKTSNEDWFRPADRPVVGLVRVRKNIFTALAREAASALEKVRRVPLDGLEDGVAAHVKKVGEIVERVYEDARAVVDRKSEQFAYNEPAFRVINSDLDELRTHLSVEAVAVRQRLQWLCKQPIGSPVGISESFIAEALECLSDSRWVYSFFEDVFPDGTIAVLWDSAARATRYGRGEVALQAIVDQDPKSEDGKKAAALLVQRSDAALKTTDAAR